MERWIEKYKIVLSLMKLWKEYYGTGRSHSDLRSIFQSGTNI
jgi:hypothetical protein